MNNITFYISRNFFPPPIISLIIDLIMYLYRLTIYLHNFTKDSIPLSNIKTIDSKDSAMNLGIVS